jgi:hypothetical protein
MAGCRAPVVAFYHIPNWPDAHRSLFRTRCENHRILASEFARSGRVIEYTEDEFIVAKIMNS